MPSQKMISVKAKRRLIHGKLRRASQRVVDLVTVLEATDRGNGFPANPYSEILGAVEEYYNQLADEFDDPPGKEPAMQGLEEAYAKARDLNREACDDPLAPLGIAEANVPPHGKGGSDAVRLLQVLATCPGIDTTEATTGLTYRAILLSLEWKS